MKKIQVNLLSQMEQSAASSPRLRSHHNFHPALSDSVNRLCIYLKKGSYIRPHRHAEAHKWELIIALKGQIGIVIYNDDGQIIDKFIISPSSDTLGFEMNSGTWHSLYALSKEAAFFEVKPGPFLPTPEEDFADWAPKEGEVNVEQFLIWQITAGLGQKYKT